MKKENLLFLFVLILLGQLSCNQADKDKVDYSKIKQVDERVYEAKVVDGVIEPGTAIGSYFDNATTVYDSAGKVLQESFFFSNGTLSMEYVCEYQDDQLSRQTILDEKGAQTYAYHFTYDDKGNLIEKKMLDAGGQLISCVKTNYEDSLATEKMRYNSRDELISRRLSHSNEKGWLYQEDVYNDEELMSTYYFSYDSSGNKVEEKLMRANSKMDYKHVFEYDEENRIVKELYYTADNSLSGYLIYTYDEGGRLVEKSMLNSDKQVTQRSVFAYNAEGQLIEHLKSANGVDYISTFIYDQLVHDRWVKKIEFMDKAPVKMVIREITYYE